MKAHVALCIFLVGCMADPPSSMDPEVAAKIIVGSDCDPWECGSNSPVIPLAGDIWDLPRTVGAQNSTGYTLTFFGKRPSETVFTPYSHKVENGVLLVWINGAWSGSAANVYGLMWRLEKLGTDGVLRRFEVSVMGVSNHPFLAKFNNTAGTATHAPQAVTYNLKWREFLPVWPPANNNPAATHIPPPFFELCGENVGDDGMDDFSAVLYEGDMLDPETITVTGDNNPNNTIGCAGHALAKQHLSGYTKASATILKWPVPSLARRTAHLKAVTGDYLGLGISLTYAGAALLRRDNFTMPSSLGGGYRMDTTGRTLSFLTVKRLEARWNERGAICLNTPRVDFRDSAEDEQHFPGTSIEDLLQQFATPDHPRPPPCTGSYTDNPYGAYITTVNYGLMPITPL